MDSEERVAVVAVSGVVAALAARWWFGAKLSPDPWESEPSFQRANAEETPLCLKCLQPKADHLCICPHCGSAMDAVARMVEFPALLGLGEAFRSGTDPERNRRGLLISLGYVLISAGVFLPLAIVYWWKVATTPTRSASTDTSDVQQDA